MAKYHQNITKNFSKMEYYYKMAIDLGNVDLMYNLMFNYKYREDREKFFVYMIGKIDKEILNNLLKNLKFSETLIYVFPEVNENNLEFYIKAVNIGIYQAFQKLKVYLNKNGSDIILRLDLEVPIPKSFKDKLLEEIVTFKSSKKIRNIYENGNNSDFQFITKEKIYNVHYFMLDSKYFDHIFSGEFEIQKSIKMEVRNHKSMDYILKYLYLGEFNWKEIENEVLEEMIEISDQYEFLDLLKNCKIAKWLNMC